MNLKIEEGQYLNPGCKYGDFFIDGRLIGRAFKHDDGWVHLSGRKMTAEEMAELMIRSNISEARKRLLFAAADESASKMLLRGIKSLKLVTGD